jgi:hypothetical protein
VMVRSIWRHFAAAIRIHNDRSVRDFIAMH